MDLPRGGHRFHGYRSKQLVEVYKCWSVYRHSLLDLLLPLIENDYRTQSPSDTMIGGECDSICPYEEDAEFGDVQPLFIRVLLSSNNA